MPDLTPAAIEYAKQILNLDHFEDQQDAVLEIVYNIIGEAIAAGRKQGWQDAGLSLDAQEVLAASLSSKSDATA